VTTTDVSVRVEHIRAISGDDEAAHSHRDSLWEAVLTAIANGSEDARGLAAAALATEQIEFERWCA
jgi:hypothetical protein